MFAGMYIWKPALNFVRQTKQVLKNEEHIGVTLYNIF